MLRVGSVRRMARPLLRFSLHASDSGSRDAAAELRAELAEGGGSEHEAALLRCAGGMGAALHAAPALRARGAGRWAGSRWSQAADGLASPDNP
jgi:hypothetical protein